MIERFEAMLAAGQDNALLRFSLGQALLKDGDAARAVEHLRAAVTHDPKYSAAWKLLGKALGEAGRSTEAIEVYARGIEVAEARGDIQAAKEMRVFQRRLEKQRAASDDTDDGGSGGDD
jgi:predicted Zn-dependent protease